MTRRRVHCSGGVQGGRTGIECRETSARVFRRLLVKETFRSLFLLELVVSIGLVLVSCGPNPQAAASRGEKVFHSASPEAKALWTEATLSVKTNGYAPALISLGKLHALPGLTPEQTKAVEETSAAVSAKMYAAANKGDPAATQALEDLRRLQSR